MLVDMYPPFTECRKTEYRKNDEVHSDWKKERRMTLRRLLDNWGRHWSTIW